MRKLFIFILTMVISYSLCSCGSGEASGIDVAKKSSAETASQAGAVKKTGGKGELTFCCSPYSDSACYTEDGYYYLCNDETKLKGGDWGSHLMYMDYATCQEIYLCSTAGCQHDTLDCPAVFSSEDFPISTTKLFTFRNHLYILNRECDQDGSITMEMTVDNSGSDMAESRPAVLYSAELDGTNRKKVFSFDAEFTLEDRIIQDENGIYVVTKKTSRKRRGTSRIMYHRSAG